MTQTTVVPDDSSSTLAPEKHPAFIQSVMSGPPLPILATAATVGIAAILASVCWQYYFGLPSTRDGVVRANVVTMAPEVPGRIVELHVIDNEYVHKGDLLIVIDPTNYSIAVQQSTSAVSEAEANVQSAKARVGVQQAQILSSQAQKEREQAALEFAEEQAKRYETLAKDGSGSVQNAEQFRSQLTQQQAALKSAEESLTLAERQLDLLRAQQLAAEATVDAQRAQLSQASANLQRTRIVAPVNGYVTNLLAQTGDYVNAGINTISIVDASSFWVDGYFEETHLPAIKKGNLAQIKLLGHRSILHGHVDSIARAINVPNAQPNNQGVATVNPVFTWVRLAQRIPVRVHIDDPGPDLVLVAGMTATVEIEGSRSRSQPD